MCVFFVFLFLMPLYFMVCENLFFLCLNNFFNFYSFFSSFLVMGYRQVRLQMQSMPDCVSQRLQKSRGYGMPTTKILLTQRYNPLIFTVSSSYHVSLDDFLFSISSYFRLFYFGC